MLDIKNLSVEFKRYNGKIERRNTVAVSSVDLNIARGEILAVIGSSGAGKSLLAHAILGILPKNAIVEGEVYFKGKRLTQERAERLRGREISLIPQSVDFLNPLNNIGSQVRRSACLSGIKKKDSKHATDKAFSRYNLDQKVKSYLPFQVSGGMARRVLTAASTIGNSDLIIADEPTTGLDPDTKALSLSYLRELADKGKSVLLISHDIESVLTIADRAAVLFSGTTIEIAKASDFRDEKILRHPYTKALWGALPQNGFRMFHVDEYDQPHRMTGCSFEPGCLNKNEFCSNKAPEFRKVNGGYVRCHYA